MENLLKIMRRLRAPDGCPWDQKQTHESLRPYLLEEAAEAVDAVGTQELAGELGDVLLQVAFHSVIAQESGEFSYEDVEAHIVEKLVRRHPHVFADTHVADADEVVTNWNAIKAQERGGEPDEKRVSNSLPALMRGAELAKMHAWNVSNTQALSRMCERLQPNEESIGALLAELATYAQAHGVNPELALRDTLKKREA